MRKVMIFAVLALVALTDVSTADVNPPRDVKALIDKIDALNDKCRGGSGDDPKTLKACDDRDAAYEKIQAKNWCYGHEGQLGYEKVWEPCSEPKVEIDFNKATLDMYSSYMSYGNGVSAMFGKENECWSKSSGQLNAAKQCAVMAMAGAIIEGGFAREQGRVSAPNYAGESVRERVFKQFSKNGFSASDAESALKYSTDNVGAVIVGLMNAGMK